MNSPITLVKCRSLRQKLLLGNIKYYFNYSIRIPAQEEGQSQIPGPTLAVTATPWRPVEKQVSCTRKLLRDVKQERETTEEAARLRLLLNGTVCSLQPLFLVGAGIFPSTGCFEMSTFVFTEPTALPSGFPRQSQASCQPRVSPASKGLAGTFSSPFKTFGGHQSEAKRPWCNGNPSPREEMQTASCPVLEALGLFGGKRECTAAVTEMA